MDYKKSIPFQLSGIALALLSVNAQAQSSCSPGSYDEPPLDGVCIDAAPGYYVPNAGATSAIPAPAGTFVNVTGASAPTLAPVGYFVDSVGQTAATAAGPGTYVATEGATSATLAPVGTFVSNFGQSAPTLAPVGKYVPTKGASEALNAPAGSFVNVTGASAATLAPPGTYVPFTGASAPIQAAPGQYVPFDGAISALSCPAGGDTPFAGSTACRDVSQTIDDPEFVSPEYELLRYSGNTINLWTDSPGPSDTLVRIRNATDDVASPISLMDLTILDIYISNDVNNVFSLDNALFDGGGNFIPITIGADYNPWSLGWGFGIGLNSLNFGQFTAQLDIVTDQNAAIGSAGDVFSYNLVGNVPEPGTLLLLSSGLMGMFGWNFRRRKLKLSA